MDFHFQEPGFAGSSFLLEQILDSCEGATIGGGAFAWATAAGLDLFLGDDAFKTFIKTGNFDLIIGLDAVTNPLALSRLAEFLQKHKRLTANVCVHDRPAIFHPKVCWFANAKGGTLITGSGNLTMGGLKGNWEAFSVTALSKLEVSSLRTQWDHWKVRLAQFLKDPSDPGAISEAAKNTAWQSRKKLGAPASAQEAVSVEVAAPPSVDVSAPVLIAEIPKAKDRWNQANFDKQSFIGFFGANLLKQKRIVLQHVDASGNPGVAESRPSVAVKSKNYRFELAAAAGLKYPKSGRPIAVFVRDALGLFRYRLVMPSDTSFGSASQALDSLMPPSAGKMRRIEITVTELAALWPGCPLLLSGPGT